MVEEFVTEKVLVMSYVNGFKVDSHDMLAKYNVNRADVIRNITRSYAHQIFVNGFFSADPHPGNLLIQTPSLQPVLLDFGLTKEIDPKTRHYFAKLLVAAAEQDVHGLMDALDGVGLKLRPDVSFDIALLSKYFFRDANKKDVAQNEAKQRREENSRAAEERRKMYYAGDKVDVFRRSWLPPFSRTSCKGEVLRVEMTHSNEEDHKGKRAVKAVVVKLTDGSEVTVDNLDNISLQKSRSPIDAWPDSFIFFDRVLGLLRGLTAALDVSQSYLEVMTPYARKALQDHHHTEMSDKEDAMQQQVDNVCSLSLEFTFEDLFSNTT